MYEEADHYLSEEEARGLYARGDSAHDFDHVLRVTKLAVQLAEAEAADPLVARLAALLHDVPVSENTYHRKAHHLAAVDFARQWLHGRGLGTERLANVVHCIEAHRFRDQSIQPQTIEAKCVYDADKLDSIGAIGVARVFAYAGRNGNRLWTTAVDAVPPRAQKPIGNDYTPVHEYVYKLQKILDALHTESARAIGKKRHAIMVDFFAKLDAEMQPEQ